VDNSEKKLEYQKLMMKAPRPLQMIAVGSVSSIFLSAIYGLVVNPWQGFAGLSVSWYLKGWSFRKMAQETGQICDRCGGEIL
jgi:type IV secretory pathway TrbD component